MFGISGIVALLQFIGMIYLPESPKWLNDRGRHEESIIAQHRIQSDPVLYFPSDSISIPPPPSHPNEQHQRKNSRTLLMSNPNQYNHRQGSRGVANRISSSSNSNSSSPVTVPIISSNYQTISSPVSGNRREVHDANDDLDDTIITATKQYGRFYRMCCCPIYQTIYVWQQFGTFIRTMISTQYRRQTYITMFLAMTQQFCGQTNVLSYAPIILALDCESTIVVVVFGFLLLLRRRSRLELCGERFRRRFTSTEVCRW